MSRIGFAVALLMMGTPVLAGEPSDAVRHFYDNPDDVFDPQNPRLGEPLVSVMKANAANDVEPCIDFSPAMDAQEWDEKEVKDTLKLSEEVGDGTASVVAAFKLLGEGREVVWSLEKAADGWKVTDIESRIGEWALSKLECE